MLIYIARAAHSPGPLLHVGSCSVGTFEWLVLNHPSVCMLRAVIAHQALIYLADGGDVRGLVQLCDDLMTTIVHLVHAEITSRPTDYPRRSEESNEAVCPALSSSNTSRASSSECTPA